MKFKLFCEKIKFDTGEREKVNFFADTTRTVSKSVDLYDYLLKDSMGDIEYLNEEVDSQTLEFFYTSSNVTFSLSAAKIFEEGTLKDFFEIFTSEFKYKWKITISMETGGELWQGVIYKENVKMTDAESQVIEITAYSFEQEFKTFYSDKALPDLRNVFGNASVPGLNINRLELTQLSNLLENIFTGNGIYVDMQNETSLALISYWHYFYGPQTSVLGEMKDILDLKNGYRYFSREGITCYDWFNSLCKSMGWIWYISFNKLIIRNRYETNHPVKYTVDYKDTVISSGIENSFSNLNIQNIVMHYGSLYGGKDSTVQIMHSNNQRYDVSGERKVCFSNNEYNNNFLARGEYQYKSGNTTYVGIIGLNYKQRIFKDNARKQYRFRDVTEKAHDAPEEQSVNLEESKTLYIDVIQNSDFTGRIHMNAGRTNNDGTWNGNYEAPNSEGFNTQDLQFTGNPANSLLIFDSEKAKYVTYGYYVKKSNVFKKNFSALLNNGVHLSLTVKGKGIISNPLQSYEIINYPHNIGNIDGVIFSMQGLKYNLEQNTFELNLLSIE